MAAPIPSNEYERLCALHSTGLLTGTHSLALDQMTRAAARVFQVPFVTLSLIDEDRQCLKSRVGLALDVTTRSDSFCSWVVYLDDMVVVEDARRDERFCDNPYVVGPPFLRFYAGAPIRVGDGQTIGAFCVLDSRPRGFGRSQRRKLRMMADRVERLVASLTRCGESTAREQAYAAAELLVPRPADSTDDPPSECERLR